MASVAFDDSLADSPDLRSYIALWTLSLAPIIAHVVVGVPQQVYITKTTPSILQRLVHLNPTSILWRYFAIVDRRLRARKWDKETLAATNTLFWTDKGWDGGEHVMKEHRTFLIRSPDSTHVRLLSASSLQTLIVAFQGVQAVLQFAKTDHSSLTPFTTLAQIFQPVAVFGLFRLLAAYWIIDDFVFANVDDHFLARLHELDPQAQPIRQPEEIYPADRKEQLTGPSSSRHIELQTLSDYPYRRSEDKKQTSDVETKMIAQSPSFPPEMEDNDTASQVHPASGWRGLAVRCVFVFMILGVAALSLIYLARTRHHNYTITGTGLCMMVIYSFFSVTTAIIFTTYMFRRASCTTIVPGLGTWWYKLYTVVLFALFAVMFVVASIEQKQPPCDGSGGNCQNLATLDRARVTFNTSSFNGKAGGQGFLDVTHVLVTGTYSGFFLSGNGTSFSNHSIGASV